ncbi:MAG: diacylglycerol kinase family protein [Chloroflexota bacterium]
MKTLIILNPHAGSGRAGKLWSKIEPLLWQELGELVVAVTQKPGDVAQHLEKAHDVGLTRVIAIGGDGTNHALINEMVRINRHYPDDPPMTFGNLPIGTGQDWSRSLGVPQSPVEAVAWIKAAQSVPLDVGQLTLDDASADPNNDNQNRQRNFLNIASVGISGMITERVNHIRVRRPWTFYQKTLEALLAYRPPHMRVRLDGKLWYEGTAYICAVANGRTFGHGMFIAPNALYDDGLFDVILIEGVPRLEAVIALNTIYSGNHLKRSDVHAARAQTVEIEAGGTPLGMELDGEHSSGQVLRFEVLPHILKTLASPAILSAT